MGDLSVNIRPQLGKRVQIPLHSREVMSERKCIRLHEIFLDSTNHKTTHRQILSSFNEK